MIMYNMIYTNFNVFRSKHNKITTSYFRDQVTSEARCEDSYDSFTESVID